MKSALELLSLRLQLLAHFASQQSYRGPFYITSEHLSTLLQPLHPFHRDQNGQNATSPPASMFPTLPLLRATSRSARNPKRIQTGLYDGRSIQSGNAVGETFNNKTRRNWLPNIQSKAVWSEALGQKLRLKVTVGALRTIDKVGGLDAYLFRMKPDRLGEKGLKLRQMVRCDLVARCTTLADLVSALQVADAHQARKLERRALAETSLEEAARP